MTEESHRWWDTITKLLAPVLAVIGLLIGVQQFTSEQDSIRRRDLDLIARNDALEFKRRTWERQLNVYMATARAVGEVVVAENPAKLREAVSRFNTLYWGTMTFVNDTEVRNHLKLFDLEVRDFREGISTATRLKVRASHLVDALRESSQASWRELDKIVATPALGK